MANVTNDAIIVSVDFTNGRDNDVMVVGRKRPNDSVEIINAIAGPEALELYNRLVTPATSKSDNSLNFSKTDIQK